MIRMYLYSENENPFILVDGRDVDVSRFRKRDTVHSLCLINGVCGLAVIDKSDRADFRMDCFGPDGLPSGDCLGAGMCAVAFADLLGIRPFHSKEYTLEVAGKVHEAVIESHLGECKVIRIGETASPVLCLGSMNE